MTLLPAILILAGCPPALEPTAPFTSRAVGTGWGEPVNGLSILAATDADTVDVGAKLEFEVFFRFWPLGSDGRVHVLNPDRREQDCFLHLVSADGSRSYQRPQFTPGSPVFRPPDDPVDLVDDPPPSRSDTFLLLAENGQQVAPGDYRAYVEYTNTGNNTEVTWFGYGDRESFPPGELWGGTVRTGSMSLHVAANEADTTWCELPARIMVVEESISPPPWRGRDGVQPSTQLAWRWDDDVFEPAGIISRPGYHLGFSVQVRKFLDDTRVDGPPSEDEGALSEFLQVHGYGPHSYDSLSGRLPQRPFRGGGGLGGPRIRETLVGGKKLRIEISATIFETSAPPESHWKPERGDYRVLIHRKIVETWPDDH